MKKILSQMEDGELFRFYGESEVCRVINVTPDTIHIQRLTTVHIIWRQGSSLSKTGYTYESKVTAIW